MRIADLKEAQQIVDGIALIDKSLGLELNTARFCQLSVKDGSSETFLQISTDVAAKALAMQKDILRDRRAQLVRRSAQIGLVLS